MGMRAFLDALKRYYMYGDMCHMCSPVPKPECRDCKIAEKVAYWLERSAKLMGPVIEAYGKERVHEEIKKLKQSL